MTGSTYIEFDKARTKGMSLIRNDENPIAGLLIITGIYTGLRVSDLLKLTYGDLRKNTLKIKEQKTGKLRQIEIHDNIKSAVNYFPEEEYPDKFHAFRSQKKCVMSSRHVNRLIKRYFKGDRISSHSLRKTFGRRVYDINGKCEEALNYLSEIFNHRDISTTRRYLGIRQEEIKNIYLNL